MSQKYIYKPSNKIMIYYLILVLIPTIQLVWYGITAIPGLMVFALILLGLVWLLVKRIVNNKHHLIIDNNGIQLDSLIKLGPKNKFAWSDIDNILKFKAKGNYIILIKLHDRGYTTKSNKIKNLSYDFAISPDHFLSTNDEIYDNMCFLHQQFK